MPDALSEFPFGRAYPFLVPGELSGVVTDLFLSHSVADAVPPLSVTYVDGAPAAGMTVRIVDATGRAIFHTDTDAATYGIKWFGSKYAVHQWRGAAGVLRVVCRTGASGVNNTVPADGRLDERASEVMPAGVTVLKVNGVDVGATAEILPGYTSAGRGAARPAVPGGARTARVYVDLAPGGGAGAYPGCNDPDPPLRRLNGVGGDEHGDLRLSAEGCYRVSRPGPVVDGAATPVLAHGLQVHSTCGQCYKCGDFVSVYKALKRLVEVHKEYGRRIGAIRETYIASRARWLAQKACREARPARVVLVPWNAAGYLTAAVSFGNTKGVCMGRIGMRLAWEVGGGAGAGAVVANSVFRYAAQTGRPERYKLGGDWPDYHAFWDFVPAGRPARLRFDAAFAAAPSGSWARLTVTPVVNGAPHPEWAESDVVAIGGVS